MQELASQQAQIESLRAEAASAAEASASARDSLSSSLGAAQAAEAALLARDEEVKKFKLQLLKAKKLRAQDAER